MKEKTETPTVASVRTHINQLLQTRIQAAKLLMPKSETTTITAIPTQAGLATRVKRETKTVTQLMEELGKEGKLGGSNVS